MKPGRNDPCPCGSGRKYKHCCLPKAEAIAPEELAWRRIRRAIDPLAGDLLREAMRRFDEAGLDEAWDEFNLWQDDEPYEDESPFAPLFLSWFIYDWKPDPLDTELPAALHGATAAEALLARAGKRLDPIARRYAEACVAIPFSFHEVIDVHPGRGFRLRDVLLGTEAEVTERSGSDYVRDGDLLFAKVVPIDGLHLIEGMAPLPLPPDFKPPIIELRRKMKSLGDLFGADLVRDYDLELREIYLAAADRLLNPRLPELRNTDGEPLEMHTLIFDLDAPQAALEALQDLGAGFTEPEIERDSAGNLLRAEITWSRAGNEMHKEWDNTSLGRLRIEGTRLTAEVNSAKRAAALRSLIEQRLGDTAQVRPTVVQSVQSMLAREPSAQERARRDRRREQQSEFAAQPEVQAALNETIRKHYRAWVDDRIPALGNRTPRQAVLDPDGREAVEALVSQIERDGPMMSPPMDPDIVRELRETLGLSGT
jgi:hypothetical protein